MSGFYGNKDNENAEYWNQGGESYFSGDLTGFGQEPKFQTFDYEEYQQPHQYDNNQYMDVGSAGYSGTILNPQTESFSYGSGKTEDFEDEPPLLEELGINPDHIIQKTLAVLNPFKSTDVAIMADTDLAGPLVFCLAFGGFLMLTGKLHFGYIYGIGVLGCVSMYCLLNLMSLNGVSIGVVISVLGYCLLPMVGLAGLSILLSLQAVPGILLTSITVLWCSISSSKLFVTALAMSHQQPLVAYPCAMLYGVFALLTIF